MTDKLPPRPELSEPTVEPTIWRRCVHCEVVRPVGYFSGICRACGQKYWLKGGE